MSCPYCEIRRQEHIEACKRVDERDEHIARLKAEVDRLQRKLQNLKDDYAAMEARRKGERP